MAATVFYISGHGFGHASRQIEIINALGARRPDLEIIVRTSAAAWLFQRTLQVPVRFERAECDTGAVQIDSLRLDERETIRRAAAFHRTLDRRAAAEAELLRRRGAALVVSDAPALGCGAAARAGIPAIVISNFTWDWIYEEYSEPLTEVAELVSAVAAAYATAEEGWRLPMHGGFASIPVIRDLPFVARHATHDPDSVRRLLKLPAGRPLVLSSFGGYGVEGFDPRCVDCLGEFGVVLTGREPGAGVSMPGIHYVVESDLYDRGLRYEDLVRAVDVVLTKPGYGIIAECVANGTALLYTSRGRFREYDVLVAEIPRFLRAAFIEQAALFAGRWREPLRRLVEMPAPPERPPTDGAARAAALLASRLPS